MKKSIVLAVLLIGCGTHNVSIDNGNSEIHIELSGAMQSAQVELNGEQVFDGKNVKVIRLRDLQRGEHTLHITAEAKNRDGSIDHRETVTLSGGTHQIHLDSPSLTSSHYLVLGAVMIGGIAITQIVME